MKNYKHYQAGALTIELREKRRFKGKGLYKRNSIKKAMVIVSSVTTGFFRGLLEQRKTASNIDLTRFLTVCSRSGSNSRLQPCQGGGVFFTFLPAL
ncbi:hypothetical protein COF07_10205 [Bacillus wiedmannii]|uniref:hypothetical protein n=1 Tax=Bacillus wiedmannii TaxID=1890302 RepID=UPI000BFE0955|nr:hypothetical protein [Bacillus wiedmannii]PHA58709.1 hypothetical protein COF07_10205 [Bacillus wiedmannii]